MIHVFDFVQYQTFVPLIILSSVHTAIDFSMSTLMDERVMQANADLIRFANAWVLYKM